MAKLPKGKPPAKKTAAVANVLAAATKAPPLVDVHCHIFNGKDIPLKEFLRYGRGVPWGLAYLVEWLITHPMSANATNKEKAKLVAASQGAEQSDFQEAEDRNLIERFFAYADLMGRSVKAIADELIDTYPCDLFTPAMVDMDCWLGDASFYDTRVQEHAAVAARKDKKKRGKVHPIIGFCPVRQVATRKVLGEGKDHLAQVKRAIEEQGFVGIKVYPPMGFRPTRNTWAYPGGTKVVRPNGGPVKCKLFADQASQAFDMTGADLDEALLELFRYCTDTEVPVMTHCTSHGAEAAKYRGYNSDPRHWRHLLTMDDGAFRNLRLNLGHFGGDNQRPSFAHQAMAMAAEFPNVYADVGAHHVVWEKDDDDRGRSYKYELMSALEEKQDWTQKLMLGTDWHTIYVEASPGIYLREYLEIFDELSRDIENQSEVVGFPLSAADDPTRRASFRGRAALRFLGLDEAGSKARKRLEKFYTTNGIFTLEDGDEPTWW